MTRKDDRTATDCQGVWPDSNQASDNRCAFDDKLVIKASLVAGSTTRWSYKAVRTIAVHTNVQLTAVLLYRRLTAFLLLQRCCISCPPLLQLLLALADLTWLAYTDFPGTQCQPAAQCVLWSDCGSREVALRHVDLRLGGRASDEGCLRLLDAPNPL